MNNSLLDIYTFEEIDTDYSKYRVKRAETQLYRNQNEEINAIFSHFKQQMDYGLFIIGNYLYFTLDNVKYWTILSSLSGEWDYINQIIEQISKIATNVCYEYGRLD